MVRRIKEKEIVVFQTDRWWCFSFDTLENYCESERPCRGVDIEIDCSTHKEIKKVLNAHGISWIRILAVGQFIGHKV